MKKTVLTITLVLATAISFPTHAQLGGALKFLLIDKTQFIGKVEPLNGNIPKSIWELENLDRLYIRNVATGGSLPVGINKLKKHFKCKKKQLTGTIPAELANCPLDGVFKEYYFEPLSIFNYQLNKL